MRRGRRTFVKIRFDQQAPGQTLVASSGVGGDHRGGNRKNTQIFIKNTASLCNRSTAVSSDLRLPTASGGPFFKMFGRAARPWSRILASLLLVLFVTDEKSLQAAAGGIPAACRAARDSWLGARSMSPAVDQKLESLSWGTGVGVGVCGGISVERENGVVLMRLRGGFTAKKSRKSKSKRKTLKLKYKIKKRVVQVTMVPPRLQNTALVAAPLACACDHPDHTEACCRSSFHRTSKRQVRCYLLDSYLCTISKS